EPGLALVLPRRDSTDCVPSRLCARLLLVRSRRLAGLGADGRLQAEAIVAPQDRRPAAPALPGMDTSTAGVDDRGFSCQAKAQAGAAERPADMPPSSAWNSIARLALLPSPRCGRGAIAVLCGCRSISGA